MIKRKDIYLGIKNNCGVITPLIGMYEQDKIKNLENGELLETDGNIYGAIDGFPSCSLDHILKAWHFQDELTEKEIHMIATIFKYPDLVNREMKRISSSSIDGEDIWMLEHVYLLMANTYCEEQPKEIREIEQEKEVLYSIKERLLHQFVRPKQKRKEWR